jgi:hypothetical protein
VTLLQEIDADVSLQDEDGVTVLTFDGTLKPAGGYEIEAAGTGQVRRRRDVATSPYVNGVAEISSVRDEERYTLIVRVIGTTMGDCFDRVEDLTDAASARRWRLRVNMGGVIRSWDCYAADYQVEQPTAYLLSYRARVVLDIPVRRRVA